MPAVPRLEREPFLLTQRKWRRRSGAPGAHAGAGPGAGRARPPAPPRRPLLRRGGSPGRRQPARRQPAYLHPGAASARAPGGPRTDPWRRGWPTRNPRAAAGPTPGGGALHTQRWPQRRSGGSPSAVNLPKAGPQRHQSARGVARPPQSSARGRGGAVMGRGEAARTRAGTRPFSGRGAPRLPLLPSVSAASLLASGRGVRFHEGQSRGNYLSTRATVVCPDVWEDFMELFTCRPPLRPHTTRQPTLEMRNQGLMERPCAVRRKPRKMQDVEEACLRRSAPVRTLRGAGKRASYVKYEKSLPGPWAVPCYTRTGLVLGNTQLPKMWTSGGARPTQKGDD